MRPGIDTLVTPGFGWVFQWREDGWWRDLDREQLRDEEAGGYVAEQDDRVRWTGTLPVCLGRGLSLDDRPRWFLVHGELLLTGAAHVRLRDGTEPAVLTLGRIWVCEWFSSTQDATVTVGGRASVMPFERVRALKDL